MSHAKFIGLWMEFEPLAEDREEYRSDISGANGANGPRNGACAAVGPLLIISPFASEANSVNGFTSNGCDGREEQDRFIRVYRRM
jgi:hypothetical protein